MEGGVVYNNPPMMNVLLKDEKIPSEILDSTLWVPNSSPSFHAASASMVSFEDEKNNPERPFSRQIDSKMENSNVDFDSCYQQPVKKRRLTTDQVRFLEKGFEVENKLEPERKIELAKELGLQPRQVAIWFQNRRARSKTKVLEKEYAGLKASFDKLKSDYDTLSKENDNMRNEVNLLTDNMLARKKKIAKRELSDPIISSKKSQPKKPIFSPNVELVDPCKQEDASSSAKSDVFDSDSPHCNNHSAAALLEPANSSHIFDPEDEDDDNRSRNLLTSSVFPKIEDEFYDDLQPNSCNLGFPVQDQGTWFWQY